MPAAVPPEWPTWWQTTKLRCRSCVIYRRRMELWSRHCSKAAILPEQFDALLCFDETCAVTPRP